jgi:hypothetical protein
MELDGGFHFSILPVGRRQVNPPARFRTSVRINLIVTAQRLCESQSSHLHPSFSRKFSMPSNAGRFAHSGGWFLAGSLRKWISQFFISAKDVTCAGNWI